MVEPVSLTLGAIVAALVAKAVDRAEDRAVEDGEGVLRRVVGLLRERFSSRDDESAATALARLEDAPDSPTRVRELAVAVDRAAEADPALRSGLEALVSEARSAGIDVESISQTAWGNQNVQTAGLVDSEVNVSYGSPPPARPNG